MGLVAIIMVHLLMKSEHQKGIQEGRKLAMDEVAKSNVDKGTPSIDNSRVDVLVAREDIVPGAPITSDMVEVKKMPKDILPPAYFEKFENIDGRMPAHFIPSGDIIMPSKVRTAAEISRAAYLVTPGKRYMSLPITGKQADAGMLRIGDRVDILATYDAGGVSISKIIIQDIKIIDVEGGDAQATTPTKPNQPNDAPHPRLGTGSYITFEVTPEDAELFKALEASSLDYIFILRNINDNKIVDTDGKRTKDVISKISEDAPTPIPEAAPVIKKRNY
jgi:pilus assembly protein CpaB